MSAGRPRSDRWILFIVIAVILGLFVGGYFVFEWADSQTPWFKRIVFSIIGVSVGARIGKALSGKRAGKTGPNWIFWGVLLVSIVVAAYLGFVRPIQRDQERDEAFISIRDDLRASTERLNQLTVEAPDAKDREGVIQYLGSVSAHGLIAAELVEKTKVRMAQFTPEQRTALAQEIKSATEALRLARSKFVELSPKKKE